jgi:hypothetical protein
MNPFAPVTLQTIVFALKPKFKRIQYGAHVIPKLVQIKKRPIAIP